jgi:hypothetical protein
VASFVHLPWGDGHETVREVNGVRHSAVPGIPRDAGRTMVASYHGYELEGGPTASGRPFDPEGVYGGPQDATVGDAATGGLRR